MSQYGVRQWNAENPEVADYLIKVSQFWKEETHCDGFRLDSAHLHSTEFWQRYIRELKGSDRDKNFFLLAELPMHPRKIGEFITASGLDSAYDFSAGIVRGVFGKEGWNVNSISFVLRQAKQFYPAPHRLCAQIDEYEDPEFLPYASESKEARMKEAVTYLLTLDRIPLLYSGDEVAAAYREVGGVFTPERQASRFLEYTKKLIALRKKEAVLRHGDFMEVQAHNPIYAYQRTQCDARILVIFNNSAEPHAVGFPLGTQQWRDCALEDLISEQMVKARSIAEPIMIEPFGARVLRVSD
jgi:glycosidase